MVAVREEVESLELMEMRLCVDLRSSCWCSRISLPRFYCGLDKRLWDTAV